mmetsp:Transcript_122409/g.305549  ORF Transcript_122409/g.305549 Transcript_122409/m.305549 type:complete len:253 (-) Transcript_122409:768-1526(-)
MEEAGDGSCLIAPCRQHCAWNFKQRDGRLLLRHLRNELTRTVVQEEVVAIRGLRRCGGTNDDDHISRLDRICGTMQPPGGCFRRIRSVCLVQMICVHGNHTDASLLRTCSYALQGGHNVGRRDVTRAPARIWAAWPPGVHRVVCIASRSQDCDCLHTAGVERQGAVVLQQHDAGGGRILGELQMLGRPLVSCPRMLARQLATGVLVKSEVVRRRQHPTRRFAHGGIVCIVAQLLRREMEWPWLLLVHPAIDG